MAMNNKITNPYSIKCVFLGDKGVGKSSLVNMFTSGYFNPNLNPTEGIDLVNVGIKLNEYKITLQIYDPAGDEKFKSLIRTHLDNTHIVFLLFDITDRQSWYNLTEWNSYVNKINPYIVLLGTKSDLKNHVVSTDEIKRRAKEWNCKCYVISSKRKNSQYNIYRMFLSIFEDFHQEIVNKCVHDEELPRGIYKETNETNEISNNKCIIL